MVEVGDIITLYHQICGSSWQGAMSSSRSPSAGSASFLRTIPELVQKIEMKRVKFESFGGWTTKKYVHVCMYNYILP